jgi:hypothetical protein
MQCGTLSKVSWQQGIHFLLLYLKFLFLFCFCSLIFCKHPCSGPDVCISFGFVTYRTIAKVSVLGSGYMTELLQEIDQNSLPGKNVFSCRKYCADAKLA